VIRALQAGELPNQGPSLKNQTIDSEAQSKK